MQYLPDINDLFIFCKVVQEGSFAKAARRIGISKATASRRVALLEEELGSQLLLRTTRTLKETEIGRDFYNRAIGILTASEEAITSVAKTKSVPSGLLRVTAGVEFGVEFLSPLLNDFLKKNPLVSAELDLTGRIVDLVYEGFDVGIRIGPMEDSSLSTRKLGAFSYGLFASPKLAKKFEITDPRGLENAPALVFTQSKHSEKWFLIKGDNKLTIAVKPRLIANNHWALRSAAIAGLGITYNPTFLMNSEIKEKKLVRILPEWGSPEIRVHAVFPAQRFLSPKVRQFVDHIAKNLNMAYNPISIQKT